MKAITILLTGLFFFTGNNNDDALKKLPKSIRQNFVLLNSSDELDVFLQKFEVSNGDYARFLDYIRLTRPNDSLKFKPKESNWSKSPYEYEPFEKFYFSHPTYQKYPVVNVNQSSAKAYCKFLYETYNTPESDWKYNFRLLTKQEYQAAVNRKKGTDYAWGYNRLTNSEDLPLCNFFEVPQSLIARVNGDLVIMTNLPIGDMKQAIDGYEVTSPVDSYNPGLIGAYNLNGNVAEMVEEEGIALGGSWRDPGYDVKNSSEKKYAGSSPEVGFRVVVEVSPKQ